MRRALLLVLLLAAPALAGCATSEDDPRADVVAYPRLGDVAVYAVEGSLVEFARWENAHPFSVGRGQVRFLVEEGPRVLDGARLVHDTFVVRTETAEAGVFTRHSTRYVSPLHQGVVQAHYPLSQAQSVLSFDERGFPWLFGASALFGADLREPEVPFLLPDNLGRGGDFPMAWRPAGTEDVDGVDALRFDLVGGEGMEGSVWIERGSAWPVRARLTLSEGPIVPHVRADAAYPAGMDARRVSVTPGTEPVPPRDRAATFGDDALVPRLPWNGEMPPDGTPAGTSYLLADAVRDAKLLDPGLRAFLEQGGEPRIYRATFQEEPGPAAASLNAVWTLQFVNQKDAYYEVQMERLQASLLGVGAPRVNASGPAEAPRDPNHGWFPEDAPPRQIVPLGEGIRIVRDLFGAEGVQVFLRSFVDPPGYSYYLDGGFEETGGRYTVVYNPNTGFIEGATGPVSPRLAP